MTLVLEKYGFLPKLRKTTKRMYEKFALELKKGVKMALIDYLTGVHRGEIFQQVLSKHNAK